MTRCQANRRGLLVAFAVAIFSAPAVARVEFITFRELVSVSDLIVLATVTKVEAAPTGLKYGEHGPDERSPKDATARVLEVWKGSSGPEVRYMASRSWVCDTTRAKVGERVVLFLGRQKGLPFVTIASDGRGRMPLQEVGAVTFAVLPDAVGLPEGTPVDCEKKPFNKQATPNGPPPSPATHYIECSIKLETLKKLVGASVR